MKLHNFVIYLGYATSAFVGYLAAQNLWLPALLLIPVWIGMLVVGNLKQREK